MRRLINIIRDSEDYTLTVQRPMLFAGHQYGPGDPIDKDEFFSRRTAQSLMRVRRVVAWCLTPEALSATPRHLRRYIKDISEIPGEVAFTPKPVNALDILVTMTDENIEIIRVDADVAEGGSKWVDVTPLVSITGNTFLMEDVSIIAPTATYRFRIYTSEDRYLHVSGVYTSPEPTFSVLSSEISDDDGANWSPDGPVAYGELQFRFTMSSNEVEPVYAFATNHIAHVDVSQTLTADGDQWVVSVTPTWLIGSSADSTEFSFWIGQSATDGVVHVTPSVEISGVPEE